jgi:ABC-type multidrug transport system fused ATPase/permease subunit
VGVLKRKPFSFGKNSSLNLVLEVYGMLNTQNKRKILMIIPIYLMLSIFDLIGVMLLATCGTISYNLISGESRPSRVELILQSLWPRDVESTQLLLYFALFAGVFLTLKTVLTSFINYRVLYWLAKQESDFSSSLFSALLHAPLTEIKSINPGEAQWAIMLGSSRLMSGVVTPTITVLSDLITVVVMATTILIATPNIALSVLFLLLISHRLFTCLLKGRMRNYVLELSNKGSQLNSQIQQTFQATREIKIFGLSKTIENLFSSDRDVVSLLGQKTSFLNGLFRYYLEITILLTAFLVVITELYFSDTRRAITTLILFLSVGLRIIPSLQRLQAINLSLQLSQGATKSYFELRNRFLRLETESSSKEFFEISSQSQGPVSVDLKELSYSGKDGNTVILDRISLQIKAGELVAVIGESGSGKTTLVDLISLLLSPESGSLIYKNEDGVELQPNRALVGYCAQVPFIFNTSIAQNLSIANERTSKHLVEDLVSKLNLSNVQLPNSDEGSIPLSERLSGGEKQRIGIARALISSRPIIIFDEPTSSLDQMNSDVFLSLINEYRKKHTIIIVTHDLGLARFSDKIVVLEKGKVKYQGDPKGFLGSKREGLYDL